MNTHHVHHVPPPWYHRAGLGTIALLLLLVVALAPGATSAAHRSAHTPSSSALWQRIDEYVEGERQAARIPGLALGIVQGDQIVHLQAFGVANEDGQPVTPQTRFYIGSVSKSMTAMAIMQLAENGQLELDAPVQRYLPWFTLADTEAAAQITVRHLLSHASGLSTATGMDAVTNRSDRSELALERQVRAWHDVELTAPVGTVFQYSNANYVILGLLVETLSGQSFETYIQNHIFAPLAMADAAVVPDATGQEMAAGYRYWFGMPRPAQLRLGRVLGPAGGGVLASAEEMARYLVAYLNGGAYQGTQVLSPASIAEMHQPAVVLSDEAAQRQGYLEAGYGLGWFNGIRNGMEVVAHAGDLPLYHADMVLVPEEGWGIILLMNANNRLTGERMRAIADGVTALLLDHEVPVVETGGSMLLLIYRIVMGLALLQIAVIAWSLATFKRWSAALQRRRRSWGAVVWHLVLPSILQLLLGLLFVLGLPLILNSSLLLTAESTPDLAYMAMASGLIGLGWVILRGLLVYRMMSSPGQAKPVHSLLPT